MTPRLVVENGGIDEARSFFFYNLGFWSTGFIMVMSLARSCCKAGMSGAVIVTANIVVVFLFILAVDKQS